MSTNFGKSFKRVGGVALASVLMASCSQNWSNSSQSASFDDRTNPYAAGKARMAAGQYGLAVQSFRKALSDDPGSVKALNALAATYDLLGRFDLAERYYRQALSLDPNSVQSLNNLGYSYYLRGDYRRARELFDRAAAIDSKNPVVAANLASVEKAQMNQQIAAAERENKTARGKEGTAPSRTVWIERSDSKVQTLVTKSDPVTARAIQEGSAEARVIHSPKPLIEISTASPERVDTVISAPVVAKADPKASSPKIGKNSKPSGTDVASVSPQIPNRKDRENDAKSESMAGEKPKTEAIASSTPAAPAAHADNAAADLPKLNDDVARDVLAASANTDGTASAKGAAPVPPTLDASSTAVKAPEKMEQKVDTAALGGSSKTVVLDPLDPVQEANAVANPLAVASPEKPKPTKEAKASDEAAAPAKTAALNTKSETPVAPSTPEKPAPKKAGAALAALRETGQIEISNGAGRLAMAARMGRYLGGHGLEHYNLTNAESYTNQVSVLYFKPGYIANAKSLSSLLPVQPDLRSNEKLKTDLRLVLGGDLLNFDRDLIPKYK